MSEYLESPFHISHLEPEDNECQHAEPVEEAGRHHVPARVQRPATAHADELNGPARPSAGTASGTASDG